MNHKKHSHKDNHEYKEGRSEGYEEGQKDLLKILDEILSTGNTDAGKIGNANNSKFVEIKKKIIELIKSAK
ncbi:hypothetical protein [Fluviispira multicolorata]|uniref:Uncharacterized protein n=1 Tax=Fluviispira multicolorata TaxID=2654512 RepID=A0A833N4R3_9BACT|nr:hypothetical protein [Fluviispira multicolorata]KAB8028564.1 hypothetical protein GCL57_12635 [Fluviispira multicolorata]